MGDCGNWRKRETSKVMTKRVPPPSLPPGETMRQKAKKSWDVHFQLHSHQLHTPKPVTRDRGDLARRQQYSQRQRWLRWTRRARADSTRTRRVFEWPPTLGGCASLPVQRHCLNVEPFSWVSNSEASSHGGPGVSASIRSKGIITPSLFSACVC